MLFIRALGGFPPFHFELKPHTIFFASQIYTYRNADLNFIVWFHNVGFSMGGVCLSLNLGANFLASITTHLQLFFFLGDKQTDRSKTENFKIFLATFCSICSTLKAIQSQV